jgi:hypothetical protein
VKPYDLSSYEDACRQSDIKHGRIPEAKPNGKAAEVILLRSPPSTPVDLWAKFDPPALPLGLLPPVLERFAIEQGEMMGADPGGLAAAALAVCAAATPDSVQLQVKKHDKTWTESARIWVGLIGEPSTKKSPILRQAAKPLMRLDGKLYSKYVDELSRYEGLPADEKKTQRPPQQKRLRVEDTTIEGLQQVLQASPGGVLCLQDELSGWFGGMDKYSGGRGSHKDRGFWLQSFNGGPYAINRVGRGAALIPNLSVSMLGGIQPELIRKLMDEAVDDGLIQRLFPIVLRQADVGRDEDRPDAVLRYSHMIEKLHEGAMIGGSVVPDGTPVLLQFDQDAQVIRRRLERRHLDLMSCCEAVNKKLAAHIGKYDGLFARLCVVWQCVQHVDAIDLPQVVTAETAGRVEQFLHKFLLPHAFAFYAGMLGLSDDHERLTAVAGYILARKLDQITNRDIQRGDRTMRRLKGGDIAAVFDQLDALGWVNRVAGLRPTDAARWQVNPICHRLFEERAKSEAARRTRDREMITTMLKGETA